MDDLAQRPALARWWCLMRISERRHDQWIDAVGNPKLGSNYAGVEGANPTRSETLRRRCENEMVERNGYVNIAIVASAWVCRVPRRLAAGTDNHRGIEEPLAVVSTPQSRPNPRIGDDNVVPRLLVTGRRGAQSSPKNARKDVLRYWIAPVVTDAAATKAHVVEC